MSLQIGTAPVSWGVWFARDRKQIPWQRFLDEVVEAGYENIELGPYGYLPTDPVRLRNELSRRRLNVSGTFVMGNLENRNKWPDRDRTVERTCELLTAVGGKYVVLIDDTYTDPFTGVRTGPARLVGEPWERLIEATHEIADKVITKYCLVLVYHPHAETHVEYEDQIEQFLQQTDPARVSLCLDLGHFAYRGGDLIRFMRRHHNRIAYLHLKSVDPKVRKIFHKQSIPFFRAGEMNLFCEPSAGVVNFPAVRDVLKEVHYQGWAVVEQDLYPCPFDKPLPVAKRTRAYLRQIGLG
jgi:inosose dehydratase